MIYKLKRSTASTYFFLLENTLQTSFFQKSLDILKAYGLNELKTRIFLNKSELGTKQGEALLELIKWI